MTIPTWIDARDVLAVFLISLVFNLSVFIVKLWYMSNETETVRVVMMKDSKPSGTPTLNLFSSPVREM